MGTDTSEEESCGKRFPGALPKVTSLPASSTLYELWTCRAVALLKSPLKLELQTSDDGFDETL